MKNMKNQGKGGGAGVLLPSPTGGVQVYHDYQRVSFKTYPGNGHAPAPAPPPSDGVPSSRGPCPQVGSSWMAVDSGGHAYSGAEDNSTDPQETLTESSTLTFVDAHTTEDSAESHSLHGAGTAYLKEFVLIDDDDDGDMSLREKTVADMSAMDARAADLVCRRLFSSSSGSVSDGKVESPAPDGPGPEDVQTKQDKRRCCLCSVL